MIGRKGEKKKSSWSMSTNYGVNGSSFGVKDPRVTPCHLDQRGKGEPPPMLGFRNQV